MKRIQRCPIFLAAIVDPGCCDACNRPLPKRRRRWCSDPCWQAYFANHSWTTARHRALNQATVWVEEDGRRLPVWRPCDNCGRDTLEGRHSAYGYWTRGGYVEQQPRQLELAAEVNHVEPRMGAGYDEGCWNHQTNLQVLCHACHVAETVDQGRVRTVELELELGRITPAEAVGLLAGRVPARLQVARAQRPGGLDLILPLWDQP